MLAGSSMLAWPRLNESLSDASRSDAACLLTFMLQFDISLSFRRIYLLMLEAASAWLARDFDGS